MNIRDDVFKVLSTLEDENYNLIYSDVCYNLGSTYHINKENKVQYNKSQDFMNKWDGIPEENINTIEIDESYNNIGNARVEFWKNVDFDRYEKNKKIKQKVIKKDKNISSKKLFKFQGNN